jgi:hypothetical protein
MTNTMLGAPMHPRKQMKCLEDMSKDDRYQTPCAEQLQERARDLSSRE